MRHIQISRLRIFIWNYGVTSGSRNLCRHVFGVEIIIAAKINTTLKSAIVKLIPALNWELTRGISKRTRMIENKRLIAVITNVSVRYWKMIADLEAPATFFIPASAVPLNIHCNRKINSKLKQAMKGSQCNTAKYYHILHSIPYPSSTGIIIKDLFP